MCRFLCADVSCRFWILCADFSVDFDADFFENCFGQGDRRESNANSPSKNLPQNPSRIPPRIFASQPSLRIEKSRVPVA